MIQEYIGSFLHRRIKREEVILPFIGGLGILAYYISVNQHKQVHLKSFMAMNSDLSKPMFYCYVGTKNHTSTDVIAKLMTKINQSQQGVGNHEGSCFELAQVPIR